MPSCDLEIELNHANRIYLTGETVHARVTVQVNQDVTCRGLKLKAFLRTHGRGNRHTGEYFSETLDGGQWLTGEVYEFRIQFQPPDYPLSYHGEYLNIDHYVRAQVDVPWAFDPKLEEEFLLAPGPGNTYADHLPSLEQAVEASHKQHRGLMVFGLIAVLIGLAAAIPTRGIGAIFCVIGAFLFLRGIRKAVAERKLGTVAVYGFERRLTSGQRLDVDVDFTPRVSTTISGATVKIVGREVCVSGSGTDRTTHRHEFHSEELTLAAERRIHAGMPVQLRGTTALPQAAPCSVKLGDNQIQWSAVVHIALPGSPDWVHEHPFQVVPGEAGAADKKDKQPGL